VFGIAGVVMVMVGILSMAAGVRAALTETSDPLVAMVLRASATSELDSGFSREDTLVVSESELIARDADEPLVSAELYVVVDVARKSTGTTSNVPLRGVEPRAMAVRGNVRIVEGRMFEPGLNEIVVGRGANAVFAGLDVGSTVTWGTNTWTVVGIMDAGGGVPESEIWADLRSLQSAYRRGSTVQTVRARLVSADAFQSFKDSLTGDPRLNVSVMRERDFYAEQSRLINGLITGVGYFVAALMGLGAVFGAVNTMYTAVASRMREIATWRALGFKSSAVFISVMLEALTLGLVGGLAGALIAYALFNGFRVATLNWSSFSQLSFAFAVTPELVSTGIVYALLMGLIGGLLPGIRAARLPITVALREL
jgi:putative ABC transport system permease protein